MIFWAGILISLAIAAVASKKGLYESWAILFNVIISVYLSITLSGVLIELLSLDNSRTASAIVMLAAALVCFGILYGLAYIIFLSQFEVKFPKIIDLAGGGFLGFLAAFLAWSLIIFVILTSPLGKKKPFSSLITASDVKSSKSVAYIQWWTGKIDSVVGKGKEHNRIDTLISTSLNKVSKMVKKPKLKTEPIDTTDTDKTIEEKTKPSELGPPPKLKFEDI